MSLELFLSKKLKEAEENDWLLSSHIQKTDDLDVENNENYWKNPGNNIGQNGYLVERDM